MGGESGSDGGMGWRKKKEEMEERRRSRGIKSYNPYLWFGSKENMLSGGDGAIWFHNADTEDFFLADTPTTAWMRYQDDDRRAWWYNQTSGEWFYEDSLSQPVSRATVS